AIEPSKMNAKDINNIVGVAWEKAGNNGSFNMINVVVGLNVNDNNFLVEKLEKQVSNQAVEINELKQQITEIMNRLVQGDKYVEKAHNEHVSTQEGSIAYYEITQEDIEAGFKLAEETVFKDWGNKIDPSFFEKIKVDAKFKADLLSKLQVKLKNALHIHKAINEKENH
ncbi:MAG: proline dehydrogenase, partial [Polaribacter sp.]